jgi:hypothetical protein
LSLFCGIDWATDHHDVAVIDGDGHVVARVRVSNDAPGFAALLTLLAEAGDNAADPKPDRSRAERPPTSRDRSRCRLGLAAVGPIWALGSLRASPGARSHYDARRAAGDWNQQAQRHLVNKFLGQLHQCLHAGLRYNEHVAFPPPLQLAA